MFVYWINLNIVIVKNKMKSIVLSLKTIGVELDKLRSTDYQLQQLSLELQPLDILWNKPYKVAHRKMYGKWMATGEHSFTWAGNMRPPSKKLIVTPVKQAWDAVSSEVIINSFCVSGITLNPNGSEDKEIHCLIEGEP